MGTQLKHRWSISHNYLAGITAGTWWRMLRENRFAVDPSYWHRAAFVSAVSLANSWWARRERRKFGEELDKVQVNDAPVFILGHWRSGTTLLHELMAQDREQFAFANTYQVVNPETFLTTEETNTRRFARLIPDKRPMDNMKLSFRSPQEDEFAPCLMTLLSPYIGISLPRRESRYDRYLTFAEAAESEVETWKGAMMYFAKKLTYLYRRPLLFKSPTHTARIGLLLALFPGARFVHIHRNPYEVYSSFRHYFDTAVWHTYLQKPDLGAIPGRIIQRYETLYGAYFDQVGKIPAGRFCDVAFSDLERDPVGEMGRIYGSLGLDGFGKFEPVLRGYVGSLSGYKKNWFPELGGEEKARVGEAWGESFERWGYAR